MGIIIARLVSLEDRPGGGGDLIVPLPGPGGSPPSGIGLQKRRQWEELAQLSELLAQGETFWPKWAREDFEVQFICL